MKILSIETSCDETGIALVDVTISNTTIYAQTINSQLFSQIDIHKEYGGVFPAVAKREHAKYLPLLLEKLLKVISEKKEITFVPNIINEIENLLTREIGLFETTLEILKKYKKPDIDMLAVTQGPGLEPALWVGISFARVLSLAWNIPLVGTNHMKGHIFSVLLNKNEIKFPAIALLISGGHTELVEMNSISNFKIIGETKDDAIGESYDKVARMIGLEYPGGPKISKLAESARTQNIGSGEFIFPRPMLHSKDLDFSFSGLKTSVLYKVRDIETLTDTFKMNIAHEFEQAVMDVLLQKINKALSQKHYSSFIASGGVIANSFIRNQLKILAQKHNIPFIVPSFDDSTDNAQMIAVAGAIEAQLNKPTINPELSAQGNLSYF